MSSPSPHRHERVFGNGRGPAAGAPDTMFVLDEHFRLVAAGPTEMGAASDAGGILGVRPLQAIHWDDLGQALDLLARLRDRPRATEPLTLRARDGTGRWVRALLVATNCLGDPEVAGIVVRVHLLGGVDRTEADAQTGTHLSVAEILPAGIAICDDLGGPVYLNDWLRRRLGTGDGDDAVDWRRRALDTARAGTLVEEARRGRSGSAELWFDFLDGRQCLRVHVAPHRSSAGDVAGVVCTFADITEAATARHDLERSERLLEATLDAVSQGIVVVDADQVVTRINRAAAGMLGFPADELLGRPLDGELLGEVVEADEPVLLTADDDVVVDDPAAGGEARSVLHRVVRPDGEPRWYSISTRVIPGSSDDRPLLVDVFDDVTESYEHLRSLSREARHDPLTGLPNRKAVLDDLSGALARSRRRGSGSCGVLFCDLDGFKAVNDAHGHAVGDRVLVVVADRIRRSCRDVDRVGRLGGDEFLVVLEDLRDTDEMRSVAARITETVSEPIPVGTGTVRMGVSIGAALSQGDTGPAELVARADKAMYAAKGEGRGGWREWGAEEEP